MGKGAEIGDFVWIFPNVVVTNDPLPPSGLCVGATIGDGAIVCTASVVLPGTKLGRGAFVAAMTRAGGDVPAASVVVGGQGKIIGSLERLTNEEYGISHPWMKNYTAYPEDAQDALQALHDKLVSDIRAYGS